MTVSFPNRNLRVGGGGERERERERERHRRNKTKSRSTLCSETLKASGQNASLWTAC